MTPLDRRIAQRRSQYRFGNFELDVASGFLRHRGEEVPLQPKALEVLTYLVERHGQVVSKDELIEAIWQEAAVTDNSLAQCMVQIRRALRDHSQQLIRTVARRGYVFSTQVTVAEWQVPNAMGGVKGRDDHPSPATSRQHWLRGKAAVLFPILALAVAVLLARILPAHKGVQPVYSQITNFPDSASGPVLSRDGRMVAFFRSDRGFATDGAIYIKVLPNREAVQIARDPRNKYGLAFSPDGSQLAYTVWENNAKFQWQTFTVPVLGGEPRLLLANAAGLTWLDERQLLYSEIRSGLHMGVVTSSLDRTDRREIYFPKFERRMAHYSYVSPDRKWVLVPEMEPAWLPCRIVPFDGSSAGWQVGPRGSCTSAGWSPDGKWMYFGGEVSGARHLWRQRFPKGELEQITFGPAEEEGVAVAPDGSLLTSVALSQSAVWIHNPHGERAISPEGYAAADYLLLTAPLFSLDGRHVYYLLRPKATGSANEIWRTNLETKASECVVRGFSVLEFDISGEAQGRGEVVFSTQSSGEPSEIWLAPLDRSTPPKRIAASGEGSPHFGPNGTVWFRYSENHANYVGLMNKDGSGRRKVTPRPISSIMSSSPDGRWLVAMAPGSDQSGIDTIAIPADGGESRLIGRGRLPVTWARDGSFLYIGVEGNDGQSVAIPISAGELPALPAEGIRSREQAGTIRGARRINGFDISPGPNPSIFAYVKTSTHRNLFRISLQ